MKETFKTTKAYAVVEKIGDVFHVDLYYYEDGKIEEKTFKNETDLTKFMATLGQIEKAREIKHDPSMNQRPGPQNRKKANKGRKNKADEPKTAMVEAGKQRVPLTAKAFALRISSSVETKTFPGKVQKEGEEYVVHFNYGMSFQVFPGIACTATVAIRQIEKDVMIAGSIRGDFDEAWAKKGQECFYKTIRPKAEELGFKAQPPADATKGEVDFKGFYDLKGKVAGENAFVIKKQDIQAITSFINESFNCWLVESVNKAKNGQNKVKLVSATNEQLRCFQIHHILTRLKKSATTRETEELEGQLSLLVNLEDHGLESVQQLLYDPEGADARDKLAGECGLPKTSFNFARKSSAAAKKPAKKSQQVQKKGKFIIHQETQFGMQPLSDEYDVQCMFPTKEAAEFYIKSMIADDPKLDTDAFRVVNVAKKKSKREFVFLEVRPVGSKTEQGYNDWYWFVPIAKRAINTETGRMARRYKISKPGKGSQFVTFDVGSKEQRQIPGVQGLGYTVGLSKKILKGLTPGDVVFGSKLHVQRTMIERDVLKLDAGYTTDDLEAVIEKIYGEWLLKDLSKDLGKDFTSFKVIAKGTDYVISFK